MLSLGETRALTIAAEDLIFAPGLEEVRSVLQISPDEGKNLRLALVQGLMVRLLQAEQRVQQYLVAAVRFIETQELWKYDVDLDGNRFRSMTAYLPFLLDMLKREGYTDSLGVRQMRTWLAADKVLVQSGLMDWEQIQDVGIGVVEKVLQATGYDKKTGEIPEELPEGSKKLNRSQAKALLDEVMENRDSWTVQTVAREADDRRGVTRKRVYIAWAAYPDGYHLHYVALHIGDEVYNDPFTREQAEQFMKLIGGTSNLEEVDSEDWI